ncbi:MAG: hypothetical protein GTO14_01300 [Anaerolineales bacterium]|nr:hypothetical protein [Anaerolineales bacterium]
MPYIIDGHNLIAHTPGISLSDPDDEMQLMMLLHAFCAREQKRATVYFDRRAAGQPDPAPIGGLRAHFVTPPRTADEAIRAHLVHLGPDARNWTVVSSDRQVMSAAIQVGARHIDSRVFAEKIVNLTSTPDSSEKPDPPSSPEELAAWQEIFGDAGGNE